jgi:uncharacterized protein YdhG (YjbR/CyaY superfamily)
MIKRNEVDLYIESFNPSLRERLNQIRKLIITQLEDVEEKISYQMPTYKRDKNLIHFACYQHHIGIYPTPRIIEKFADELKTFKHSKGAFQIQHIEPLPIELLNRILIDINQFK